MPYEIKMQGSKHCVFKKGATAPVKCHPTHAQALAHQRALTMNVKAREQSPMQMALSEPGAVLIVDIIPEEELDDSSLR